VGCCWEKWRELLGRGKNAARVTGVIGGILIPLALRWAGASGAVGSVSVRCAVAPRQAP